MFPALYAIIDATAADSAESLVSYTESLLRAGVRLIQLRAKRLSSRQTYDLTLKIAERIKAADGSQRTVFRPAATFIVNDRPDIAVLAGAGGVHVGQDDLPVQAARKICPIPQWVGVSTHNIDQLRAADATSADYIAVGPIFSTASKENPDPVVGLDFLRTARKLTRKPLVAIGGITVQSAPDVFRAGADSVAVISDLKATGDTEGRAREYLEIASRIARERS
ncbi:MAG TPA: thiamine phosphate synthase [Candidatus Acidoferrales bacterium]